MPMARRIVLVTLRWLTGRSFVLLLWWTWPMVDVKSEMREKFCSRLLAFLPSQHPVLPMDPFLGETGELERVGVKGETHPVVVQRVHPRRVEHVRRPLALPLPLAHLVPGQVVRRQDVALAPPPRHLVHVLLAQALRLGALLQVGALVADPRVALVRAGDEALDLLGRRPRARALRRAGRAVGGAALGAVEGEEGGG